MDGLILVSAGAGGHGGHNPMSLISEVKVFNKT